jgi:hypothetical protein
MNKHSKLALAVFGMLITVLLVLGACTPDSGIAANGSHTTTTLGNTPTTTTSETASPTTVTTSDPPKTTVLPTTTPPATTSNRTKVVGKPAVGKEFNVPVDYDDWTVLDFSYQTILSEGEYHFPWELTIRNDTDKNLDLTAYIIHWGFHNWVGFVTEKSFSMNAGETGTVSGEDQFDQIFYEQMVYLEVIDIQVFVAED